VVDEIDDSFDARISNWIKDDKIIRVNFPDETASIVDGMIKKYARQ